MISKSFILDTKLGDSLYKFSDKAILPQILLKQIIDEYGESDLPHPLIFKASNGENAVYMGVQEFDSQGRCGIPWVIQQNLGFVEQINIELVELPKAKELVLKPLGDHVDNWKYFLEAKLRRYTAIAEGTILRVDDLDRVYELYVEKTLPEKAVCVVDTDINLDISGVSNIVNEEKVQVLDEGEFELGLNSNKILHVEGQKGKNIRVEVLQGNRSNVDIVAACDKLVTKQCYEQETMSGGYITVTSDDFYLLPFIWQDDLTKLKITIEEPSIKAMEESNTYSNGDKTISNDETVCSNCEKIIPKSKMFLHESFCKRNNVKCECGSVFLKEIPKTHWKCELCSKHGNDDISLYKHRKLYHSGPYICDSCDSKMEYSTAIDLVLNHKATECPGKLHECRFCHLIVPQEETTYQDRYNGLSHHESSCGNKTVDCPQCANIVRVKDLKNHSMIHQIKKAEYVENVVESLMICTNVNCVNLQQNNDLQLCDVCYGPLFAQVHDPTGIKLQNRLERRYVIQLSKGCGNSWCKNEKCKSSGLIPIINITEAVKEARKMLEYVQHPMLPKNEPRSLKSSEKNKFWFCVDQSTTQRKLLTEHFISQGKFQPELIYKAVNEAKDVSEHRIQEWLQVHCMM